MPRRHLHHARPLELAEIDRAGDGEVVADDDRVAAFFRRPPRVPLAPHRRRRRTASTICAVVVGEVVLGEEVDEQRAAHRRRQRRRRRGRTSSPSTKSRPAAPRHHLVREPLLRRAEMAVEQPGRRSARARPAAASSFTASRVPRLRSVRHQACVSWRLSTCVRCATYVPAMAGPPRRRHLRAVPPPLRRAVAPRRRRHRGRGGPRGARIGAGRCSSRARPTSASPPTT